MPHEGDRGPQGPERRWIVSQCGAREHYAVPRSFHMHGQLRRFYTDIWARSGRSLLKRGSAGLRALAGRFHPQLPPERVRAFSAAAMARQLKATLVDRPATNEAVLAWELVYGKWYAERVNRELRRMDLDPGRDCFFGFLTQSLETLELLRGRGVTSVIDQAAPGRVEDDLVLQEVEKWPGWGVSCQVFSDEYYQRLEAEWKAASLVLVNSEWSKQAVSRQGVSEDRIIVVPLAYEPSGESPPPRRPASDGPLMVLWLGSVILRKGIQYLIEAAKLLGGANVRFVVAGPIGVSQEALATAPGNMSFIGRVTRDRSVELYRQADLFVLPTISDGFAITQIEAMAYGVPVVTTPNCGEVVTPEVDGLIVPAGDAPALAAAIDRLERDRPLLASMSRRAVEKSRMFSVRAYGERVNAAVSRFKSGRPAAK